MAPRSKIVKLPPEVRRLVHRYGWDPVKVFLDLGVSRPRHLEHLIRVVRQLPSDGGDRVLG